MVYRAAMTYLIVKKSKTFCTTFRTVRCTYNQKGSVMKYIKAVLLTAIIVMVSGTMWAQEDAFKLNETYPIVGNVARNQ